MEARVRKEKEEEKEKEKSIRKGREGKEISSGSVFSRIVHAHHVSIGTGNVMRVN